jgi:hypothetical protein
MYFPEKNNKKGLAEGTRAHSSTLPDIQDDISKVTCKYCKPVQYFLLHTVSLASELGEDNKCINFHVLLAYTLHIQISCGFFPKVSVY